MGTAIKPTIRCNLSCTYCYEGNIRAAGNAIPANEYDLEALLRGARKQLEKSPNMPITLHGGEPLLMKIEDIEEIFKLSYEITGANNIQTNGELINDKHIALFKKYNCHVGVSYDGPGELFLGRWKGTREATLKAADTIWKNILRLRENKISVGIIAIITRKNGLPEHREIFKKYLLDLKAIGINGGRLNPVEVDTPELREEFELTPEELTEFYVDMGKFVIQHQLNWTPFRDIIDGLLNLNLGTCIYNQCDWYHTLGEEAILPDGEIGGCLKTAKDGVMFLRDEYGTSDERYQILRNIPMEEGGCGGCRFWSICGGLCPAEAGNDWRGKSRNCNMMYTMCETFEQQLKGLMPNITLSSDLDDGKSIKKIDNNSGHLTFERMLNMYDRPSSWKLSMRKKSRGIIPIEKVEVK